MESAPSPTRGGIGGGALFAPLLQGPVRLRGAGAGRVSLGSAGLDRDEVAEDLARVDLARAADAGTRLLDHLVPLGDPAREAAEGEEDREHLGREAHGPVDQA